MKYILAKKSLLACVIILCALYNAWAGQPSSTQPTTITTYSNSIAEDTQPVATDLELMEKYGSDLKGALPALLEGLQSDDVHIRRNAAFGLGELGADGRPALEALARVLKTDSDFEVRRNAAFALGEIGEPAIPVLLTMLNDKDPRIRRVVTAALVRIGFPAVPHLVQLLRHSDTTVRRNAAVILGGIGPQASDALPALEKSLQDPDKGFQWTVKQAIRKIKQIPDDAAASEITLSPGPTDIVARSKPAHQNLTSCETVQQLLVRLSDEKSEVRRQAAFALAKKGQPAIPALIQALQSDNTVTRKNAVFALGEMGKDARSAIPAIEKLMRDPDPTVRWIAENALKKIEGRGAR